MIKRVDASREDIRHTLNTLDRECFPVDELCSKDGFWWLAYDDKGKAIAFAGYRIPRLEPKVGYLCRAGVTWKHRGKGIQRDLIRVRVAHARKSGLTHLITDTTENTASANNLIRAGFELYRPDNPWSMTEALYWIKEL